jgi:hypothetical protein
MQVNRRCLAPEDHGDPIAAWTVLSAMSSGINIYDLRPKNDALTKFWTVPVRPGAAISGVRDKYASVATCRCIAAYLSGVIS